MLSINPGTERKIQCCGAEIILFSFQQHFFLYVGSIHISLLLQIKLKQINPFGRRKAKSSRILLLFSHGMLSSKTFKFLQYLYPFQRYAKFSFSDFLTVHNFLKTMFIAIFMLNSYLLEIFLDIFYRLKMKAIKFFLTVRDPNTRLFRMKYDFNMFKIL